MIGRAVGQLLANHAAVGHCALYALLGAISLSELGTAMPRPEAFTSIPARLRSCAGFSVGWPTGSTTAAVVPSVLLRSRVPVRTCSSPQASSALIAAPSSRHFVSAPRRLRLGSRIQQVTVRSPPLPFLYSPRPVSPPSVASGLAAWFCAVIRRLEMLCPSRRPSASHRRHYDGWSKLSTSLKKIPDAARHLPRA